jgi:hypothetical protein
MAIRLKVTVVFVFALTAGSMAQTVSRPADITKNGDDVRPQESLQSEIQELRQKIESQQSQITHNNPKSTGLSNSYRIVMLNCSRKHLRRSGKTRRLSRACKAL